MKMYKMLLFAAAMLCGAMTMASCDDDDNNTPDSTLSFSPDKVEVAINDTTEVTISGGKTPYTVSVADATIVKDSIDADNASKLFIIGIKAGTTNLAVKDSDNVSGQISVTVKETVEEGGEK